jgi:DNA gyrase/topoisomerase IV subunit B
MFVLKPSTGRIVNKTITFTPGLYKIFDEILVNAADNKQRDPNMDKIDVTIDADSNTISVKNNGQGIPVEIHKEHKVSLEYGILCCICCCMAVAVTYAVMLQLHLGPAAC